MTPEKTRNMCLDEAYELDAVKKGLEPNPVFPAGQAYLRINGSLRVSSWGEPPPKKNTNPPIKDLVSKDIESRADMGFGKYGTYLQGNNGRNALKDAYEEALDLCMYLRQKLYEEQGK